MIGISLIFLNKNVYIPFDKILIYSQKEDGLWIFLTIFYFSMESQTQGCVHIQQEQTVARFVSLKLAGGNIKLFKP